jgi:hypothetical protein
MKGKIVFDRPWEEQDAEVQALLNKNDYDKIAEVMGFNIKSRKKSFEKFLTNIRKYAILKT